MTSSRFRATFSRFFDGDDLLRVPNFNTIVRTLVGGVPTQPFSMLTLPALGTPNEKLATALKQLSAAKYGRPKAKVEAEIFGRLATKEPPKPTYPAGSPLGSARPQASGTSPRPTKPAGGSSFLDEWLAKKRVQQSTQTRPTAVRPAAAPAQTTPSPQPSASQRQPASYKVPQPPIPQPQPRPELKKTDGEIDLSQPTDGDSIYIDSEGNFVSKQSDS